LKGNYEMKKATILSVSKSPLRNVYGFKKEQKVIEPIINILSELKFDWFKNRLVDLFVSDKYRDGKTEKRYVNIKKEFDNVYYFTNKTCDVNLFVGRDKIFLVIQTKKDEQQEISKIIFKFADFKK